MRTPLGRLGYRSMPSSHDVVHIYHLTPDGEHVLIQRSLCGGNKYALQVASVRDYMDTSIDQILAWVSTVADHRRCSRCFARAQRIADGTIAREYEKLPVRVVAARYTGSLKSRTALQRWMEDGVDPSEVTGGGRPSPRPLIAQTLNGPVEVNAGDYLIRGLKGEFYPCASDIFADTYKLINEGSNQ